jgi:hypothetical protein
VNATSPRFRRRIAAAAVVVTAPGLAACGVSFGAQTDKVYQPADGVSARGGQVDVLNALIVSDTPGTGRLIAGLSNENTSKSDAITGVRGAGESQSVTFSLNGGSTTIPAGGFLQLADASAANIVVSGSSQQVAAGGFVRLTISFQNAQEATLNVPVMEPDETYKDVQLPASKGSPSPATSGSPSPSTSESPLSSPAPSPTAS